MLYLRKAAPDPRRVGRCSPHTQGEKKASGRQAQRQVELQKKERQDNQRQAGGLIP